MKTRQQRRQEQRSAAKMPVSVSQPSWHAYIGAQDLLAFKGGRKLRAAITSLTARPQSGNVQD